MSTTSTKSPGRMNPATPRTSSTRTVTARLPSSRMAESDPRWPGAVILVFTLEGNGRRGRVCQDDVGLQADQLLREPSYSIDVTAGPTKVHPHVAANGPSQVHKRLRKRRELSLP